MKNKKGFTLIELLAIIVILAIIAVITVPIILNIIENSKKGAASDSAYGYKDAIRTAYIDKLSTDSDYNIENGIYTVSDLKTLIDVSTSGKEPSSNSWVEIEKNNVTTGCLQYNDYKVEFEDGKISNTEKGTCETISSTQLYGYKSYNPDTKEEIAMTIGTSNTTGKAAYLKYPTVNGTVIEGTIPYACVNSDTYGGELCLSNGTSNFNTNVNNIKNYFGYITTGANAWQYDANEGEWNDPIRPVKCYISDSHVFCHDSNINIGTDDEGNIHAYGDSERFYCFINGDDNYADCDW